MIVGWAMPIDFLAGIVVLSLASVGLAKIIRSFPGADLVEARLVGTWTGGKPLNCWTCLCFWSSLFLGALSIPEPLSLGIAVLGATGLGSTVLTRLEPPVPTFGDE